MKEREPNGRFSIYVTDSTKPDNCRKIVNASRELLEKEILKFYKEREKQDREKKTVSMCREWKR